MCENTLTKWFLSNFIKITQFGWNSLYMVFSRSPNSNLLWKLMYRHFWMIWTSFLRKDWAYLENSQPYMSSNLTIMFLIKFYLEMGTFAKTLYSSKMEEIALTIRIYVCKNVISQKTRLDKSFWTYNILANVLFYQR